MNQSLALVIDDEPDICELLTLTLGRMNIRALAAADIASARQLLAENTFDLCLTDMRLPDGDGLELVEWMQVHLPGVPVAVITAHGNVETAVQALKLGAFDFISKPLDLGNLRNIVANALRLRAGEHAASSELQGKSPRIQALREMINKVARSQAPVHISGESGTGKELVARLIHDNGPRADAPFVPVNCGAIPTELMESEFFGHRKGSFTGAVSDKAGLLQSAENGTLFLDEIADLPLPMQVKLLRVIQEKTVRPVGAQPKKRSMYASCRPHIAISPRWSRPANSARIFTTASMLSSCTCRRCASAATTCCCWRIIFCSAWMRRRRSKRAPAAHCLGYAFPGNVRELENILERAVTLCDSGKIKANDLHMRKVEARETAQPSGELGQQVEDMQRQAIVEALEKTRHNKTQAAKLLGLSFRQLRYRIKKLGIE